jgi:hypothetical protein
VQNPCLHCYTPPLDQLAPVSESQHPDPILAALNSKHLVAWSPILASGSKVPDLMLYELMSPKLSGHEASGGNNELVIAKCKPIYKIEGCAWTH